jgi:hypothetical protein
MVRGRFLLVRRGGRGGRQGAEVEAGDQGGEFAAETAQIERDHDRLRQVEEAAQATGAKRRQHHCDDAVEGSGQVLKATVIHDDIK